MDLMKYYIHDSENYESSTEAFKTIDGLDREEVERKKRDDEWKLIEQERKEKDKRLVYEKYISYNGELNKIYYNLGLKVTRFSQPSTISVHKMKYLSMLNGITMISSCVDKLTRCYDKHDKIINFLDNVTVSYYTKSDERMNIRSSDVVNLITLIRSDIKRLIAVSNDISKSIKWRIDYVRNGNELNDLDRNNRVIYRLLRFFDFCDGNIMELI